MRHRGKYQALPLWLPRPRLYSPPKKIFLVKFGTLIPWKESGGCSGGVGSGGHSGGVESGGVVT